MYKNKYNNTNEALQLLKVCKKLSLGDKYNSPSLNETTAYNTILADNSLQNGIHYLLHSPTRNIMVLPQVGMGVTLCYPNDSYPYEIVQIHNQNTISVRPCLKINKLPPPTTNVANFLPDTNATIIRIHLNKKGRWQNGNLLFSVGEARYFIDWLKN
jgi:hypothetical protein